MAGSSFEIEAIAEKPPFLTGLGRELQPVRKAAAIKSGGDDQRGNAETATVREAVRPDGSLLARVIDYRAPYVEVPTVTCADVLPKFPRRTYEIIISHLINRR